MIRKLKRKVENKRIYFAVLFEIVFLSLMIIASAYPIGEVNYESQNLQNADPVLIFIGKIGSAIFGELASVSALEGADLISGVATCIQSKTGKNCQEYAASECSTLCDGACIPSTRDQVAVCKLGTCYDVREGVCQLNSPKGLCEVQNGKWFDDPYGNLNQCKEGCCIINGQSAFVTSQQCSISAARAGVSGEFKPEIKDVLSCVKYSTKQEEGACILAKNTGNTCRLTTSLDCSQNLKGTFYSGKLCTAPELGTDCTKNTVPIAKCVDGRDEIYFYDSCGNRANIYDSLRVNDESYWTNIVSKEDSCSLGTSANPFASQKTCGNCNYFLGSVCGAEAGTQTLADSNQNVVCKELSCVDENGKQRSQGESWCAYQGAIGVQDGRSADTPGSRHYRKVCIDGEIKTDPCADYRNEICVQSDADLGKGKTFSSAACRLNLAYTCFEYNKKDAEGKCEDNPDCFINEVRVSKDFKFDMCVPKYKPGFNLETRGEGASAYCKYATQSCTYLKIKELGGDKEINKECLTEKFAQEMNDLCMSLGDCGAQANYVGEVSKSYQLTHKGKKAKTGLISEAYLAGLKKLADEKLFKGQKPADPGLEYFGTLGIPGTLGFASLPRSDAQGNAQTGGMVLGIAGLVATIAAKYTAVNVAIPATGSTAVTTVPAGATSAAFSAAAGAISGAAIGLALTSFLLSATGVDRGLSPAATYALMAAGAAGGALLGLAFAGVGGGAGGLAAVFSLAIIPIIGWIILVIIVIVILIFTALGIGDVTKIKVTYTCQPWQAPLGGKQCNKCGSDGLPCSKYACASLGQTCEFINEEETGVGECVDVNPNDAAAPIITPNTAYLPIGYISEKTDFGITLKSGESDGCIKETNSFIPLGINLNEPGQCRMAYNHTTSFEEMDIELGSRYTMNHSLPLAIPSLESLGVSNPHAKLDLNIYLRCQDKSGNVNEREYAVKLCIKQGVDVTPPVIVDREPYLETISVNAIELNASVFTNEPSECKWSSSDTAYASMTNSLSCANEFEDRELLGWRCGTTLPIGTGNEQTFYIRCLDQPWLVNSTNSSSIRNVATSSYQFKVKRSANALVIDSLTPTGESIVAGQEPASVTLQVKTSGGYDGTARCTYRYGNSTPTDFLEGTWTNTHKQVFNTLSSGTYEIPVQCEDRVGNIAESTASFTLTIDTQAPKASRVYIQGSELILITNEASTCAYSLNTKEQCSFDINNASQMNGDQLRHTLVIDASETYYLKCKDSFNNYAGSCNIIVKKGKI